SGGRAARYGDVEVGGDVSDQRRVDTLQHAVLRPVELRGGLCHRQQGGGDRQCRAKQPGDDGDYARGAMVGRSGHGARWSLAWLQLCFFRWAGAQRPGSVLRHQPLGFRIAKTNGPMSEISKRGSSNNALSRVTW